MLYTLETLGKIIAKVLHCCSNGYLYQSRSMWEEPYKKTVKSPYSAHKSCEQDSQCLHILKLLGTSTRFHKKCHVMNYKPVCLSKLLKYTLIFHYVRNIAA